MHRGLGDYNTKHSVLVESGAVDSGLKLAGELRSSSIESDTQ